MTTIKTDRIMKSIVKLLNDIEVLAYDFIKLAMVDGYFRRYLKSYVATAILLLSFELTIDRISKAEVFMKEKYD